MTGRDEGVLVRPADRPDAYVVRLDGMDQSLVDLADPARLDFPYMRRLGDLVDQYVASSVGRLRVVHVGGAGLTLPRYIAAIRPGSAQVVLEPDVAVTELVRSELPLPTRSGIKVRPLDGRTGLAALTDGYADLVVVDAFAAGRVPGDLITIEAWADVARVLAPPGWVLVNLVDRAPFVWSRRALAGARTSFGSLLVVAEPAVLRARRSGNLVVAASRSALPVAALRAVIERSGEHRLLADPALRDSLGGGSPFVGCGTEPSPSLSR